MGVDFGSEFYKISMIAPGKPFVILENTFSQRKTPSAISFTNEERIYEAAAAGKKIKYPESTFWFMQKFLAAMESNEKTIAISKEFYEDYILETDKSRQTLNFKIPHFHLQNEFTHNENGDFILSAEEVLAMILIHAKELAEKQISSQIRDCVFTVPSNWDLPQKNALYTSAQLANLTILSFIKENTAAALTYGFERQDVEASHLALFYNLGSSSSKVSVVDYTALNVSGKNVENIRVLADDTDEELSARHFDLLLAKHAAKLFDELPQRKGKKSILESRANFRRLLKEISKFKEILSANKEAFFYVESLMDDIDFKVLIERATFESICRQLIEKIPVQIEKVLNKAGKQVADINAIEIIGGGVRIPMVQARLSEFFQGKEIGAHLNGDEAMASGAVFQAANYSSLYRVRPIWVYDGYDYGIKAVVKLLESGEVIEERNLFEKNDYFGKRASFEINERKNLQLIFERMKDDGSRETFKVYNFSHIEGVYENLQTLNITNFSLHFNATLCSVKGVDILGYAHYNYPRLEEVEELIIDQNDSSVNESNSTDTNAENEKKETENSEEESKNATNNSNDSSSDNNITNTTKKPQFKRELRTVFFKKEKKLNYSVWTIEPRSLNDEEMLLARRKIEFLNEDENLRKETAQTKNSLEELIYKINEYNTNELYLLVSNETQREPINLLAGENQNWLESDEGYAANLSEYKKRFQELRNLTNHIAWRMEEYKMRPKALNDTEKFLKEWEEKVLAMNGSHPWVLAKEKMATFGLIKKAQHWLEENIGKQNNMSLTEDPVIRVYELSQMLEVVGDNVTALKNIKPPKNYYEDLIKKMNFNFTKNATEQNKSEEEQSHFSHNAEEEIDLDLDSDENNENENEKKSENEEKNEKEQETNQKQDDTKENEHHESIESKEQEKQEL